MKKVLASLLIVGFFVVSAVPVMAGLPSHSLPSTIPSSAFPKLIGTWAGELNITDKDGVHTVEVELKITYQVGRRFRGWVTQGTSTTEVFVAGVAGPGSQILIKVQSSGSIPALIAEGEMDWTTNNAAIDARCFSLDSSAAAGTLFLRKTTP
ncbi:MAG: hypothetical protein AB9866_00730 [Syntrophobacteraceae bacterium]